MAETDFERLRIEGDDVLNSGWKPPTQEDIDQLMTVQGAADIDVDKVIHYKPFDTFLWLSLHRVLQKVHGEGYKWKPQFQNYGTCVGQADKLALDELAALATDLYGDPFNGRFAVAGTYTISRVEIGGQPGRWEGSNGYQAAAGNLKVGCLLLKDIGLADDDLSNDEKLAMKWTASRAGVPEEYENKARQIVIKDVVSLGREDTMLAAKLVQLGCPQIVGTTYIPTGARDSNGLSKCKRSRGGHEMAIDGIRYDRQGNPYAFHQQNSWGTWGSGVVYPDNDPDYGSMPPGGVWISAADYAIQRADRDCSSLVGMRGPNWG